MIESKTQKYILRVISVIILIALSIGCIIPFVIVISASFSDETALVSQGYSLLPRNFSLAAYSSIFKNPKQLVDSYILTIFVTVVGSLTSILMVSAAAFPLSRKDYRWKKPINFYYYLTMVFSGGTIPTYILISKYLHMKNSIAVLIIPTLFNSYNMFLLKTYFSQLPSSLYEAAKIDGANEFYIFFKIAMPLCITGVATVLLLTGLSYWNSWMQCMLYMTNDKYLTLQYFLQRIMSNIESITKNANSATGMSGGDLSRLPSESARMAMCILSAGPMVFVSMCFQRFFMRGIAVGAVKG